MVASRSSRRFDPRLVCLAVLLSIPAVVIPVSSCGGSATGGSGGAGLGGGGNGPAASSGAHAGGGGNGQGGHGNGGGIVKPDGGSCDKNVQRRLPAGRHLLPGLERRLRQRLLHRRHGLPLRPVRDAGQTVPHHQRLRPRAILRDGARWRQRRWHRRGVPRKPGARSRRRSRVTVSVGRRCVSDGGTPDGGCIADCEYHPPVGTAQRGAANWTGATPTRRPSPTYADVWSTPASAASTTRTATAKSTSSTRRSSSSSPATRRTYSGIGDCCSAPIDRATHMCTRGRAPHARRLARARRSGRSGSQHDARRRPTPGSASPA